MEVVSAFVWAEVVEKLADAASEGFDCALGRLAEQGLELGEGHLDRIEVRRVRRQQEELPRVGRTMNARSSSDVALG
jgi:hypothetical protein